MTILRIALPLPLKRLFDYLPPEGIDYTKLSRGMRIKVPFQSRELVGILIEVVENSEIKHSRLKRAIACLDEFPLISADIFHLCTWASDYYHTALGEVLAHALPVYLRKGKPLSEKKLTKHDDTEEKHLPLLNKDQQQAVTTILSDTQQFNVFLLDGVTGSGKTEVYLRVIDDILKQQKQVLVLIPEISLTPQTIARFQERFNVEIAVLHSSLNNKTRMQAWNAARTGAARIVIGTRSAVFTAFNNLGLIVIDEEHDQSFKQQERFRYHARDVAVMRAMSHKIPIILGSATPSFESLLNVKRARYHYLSLPLRAGNATMPDYTLIDLRSTACNEGISDTLLKAMQETLASDNQVLLFLNRRGFAPVFYCTNCAWIMPCKRCDTKLVYHQKPMRLHCHQCDTRYGVPKVCTQCQQETMQPVGVGTQRLEEVLQTHFPEVAIIRVDRDNVRRKDAMQQLLTQIHTEKKAILLGTQMLAKGHHFPNVTLVGIIDADSGLFSADFRATEQMAQLLLQVAGRAGRAEKKGNVLLQTKQPQHPLLQTLIHNGYPEFAKQLLQEREAANLPPYSYIAVFRAESYAEEKAAQFLTKIKSAYQQTAVSFLGPAPAIIAKRKGLYCQHMIVKANKRSALQSVLKMILAQIEALTVKSVKWAVDVDPLEVV